MAIVSVNEQLGARTGSINAQWQRTYTRVFIVETNDVKDGPYAVRTAVDPNTSTAIPSIGNSYTNSTGAYAATETDTGSFVQSIEVAEDGGSSSGGMQWLVTVKYGPYDATQFSATAVDWPIRVSFGGNHYDKVVWFDQAGNAIRNSAGDPFDSPITRDDTRSVITVERNELVSAFDLTLAESYRDKVNNATWNGFDAKTVKCSSITTGPPQQDANGAIFYVVTYVFEIDRDTWKKSLLDQGLCQLDSSSPARQTPITDANGQPVTEAVPLDGSGHRLASNATPVQLDFDVYPAVDFGVFNLDLSLRYGH